MTNSTEGPWARLPVQTALIWRTPTKFRVSTPSQQTRTTRLQLDRIYIVKVHLLPCAGRDEIPGSTRNARPPVRLAHANLRPGYAEDAGAVYCAVAPQGTGQFQRLFQDAHLLDGENSKGHRTPRPSPSRNIRDKVDRRRCEGKCNGLSTPVSAFRFCPGLSLR